jgi:AraC-like DNA-binding protein
VQPVTNRAVEWLTMTALTVKEIADRLSYRDPFHFPP